MRVSPAAPAPPVPASIQQQTAGSDEGQRVDIRMAAGAVSTRIQHAADRTARTDFNRRGRGVALTVGLDELGRRHDMGQQALIGDLEQKASDGDDGRAMA